MVVMVVKWFLSFLIVVSDCDGCIHHVQVKIKAAKNTLTLFNPLNQARKYMKHVTNLHNLSSIRNYHKGSSVLCSIGFVREFQAVMCVCEYLYHKKMYHEYQQTEDQVNPPCL